MRDRTDIISDLPTPRELLIAWHAAQADPRRQPSPEAPGRSAPAAAVAAAREAIAIAAAAIATTAAVRTAATAAAEAPDADATDTDASDPGASAAGATDAGASAAFAAIAANVTEAVAMAAAVTAAAAAQGARAITVLDPDYPRELARIALPPPVLFVRGRLPAAPAVAIVGSRLADGYGLEIAARFARHLAAAGVVVVSGMARGIDAAAHEGALAAPLGRTVAVLGCGMGVDYPPGQARLAAAIAARGALVSEFPCGTPARPWCFPVRNRTIAALAAVTLVVQATPRSGSLDTARHARDLGRPVYAVPGPVFSALSWGPHTLLRRGALLAGHPEDILDALPAAGESQPEAIPADGREGADGQAPTAAAAAAAPAATTAMLAMPEMPAIPAAAAVLAALRPRAAGGGRPRRSPDQVAALAGLALDTVLSVLLQLEIAGKVERLHGPAYRLVKRSARGRRQAGAEVP
jgi:DNA processing protein